MQHLSTLLLAAVLLTPGGQPGANPPATPKDLYTAAVAREQALHAHAEKPGPTLQEYRAVISAYDGVVRRFPQSGYVDNALWQGAAVANEAFERFGLERDRATARRMLKLLVSDYPVSPFVSKAKQILQRMASPPAPAATPAAKPAAPSEPASAPPTAKPALPATEFAVLKTITRTAMPDRVRVTLDFDGTTTYRSERVEDPPRVLLDLKDTQPGKAVSLGTATYQDSAASLVRVGLQPSHVTRVVVSLDGVSRYRISITDQPSRIVIDCERAVTAASATEKPPAPTRSGAGSRSTPASTPAPLPSKSLRQGWRALPTVEPIDAALLRLPEPAPEPVRTAAAPPALAAAAPPPGAPAKVSAPPPAPLTLGRGPYSMTRQLGLGASKIVIDPGHGGHDPGALGAGVSEADVVLDVALRLEKLLKAAGVEVVLTRRTDEYVPLEERAAIAAREQADLFLSIHANASRNRDARGVETYFLNFATDPAAEAVAARENAATSRTINNLGDILKAITLNNKLDESRSFAGLIQKAMATELRSANSGIRDLGVKQAPFVVLIGADMPSVLVEIAFITNSQEGRLLKSGAYRQRIAQALFDAVRGYQKSLKSEPVAMRH
jgi:N-acetylmuramoyl-L-alanine amidase